MQEAMVSTVLTNHEVAIAVVPFQTVVMMHFSVVREVMSKRIFCNYDVLCYSSLTVSTRVFWCCD